MQAAAQFANNLIAKIFPIVAAQTLSGLALQKMSYSYH